jgi:hypothetical protein
MIRVARRVFIVVVSLAAGTGCGGHAPSSGADLSVTPSGIPCGAVRCAPCASQFCDTADYGVSGVCRAQVAAMHLAFGCAGPEDCQGGVCCVTAAGSACSATGSCTLGGIKGQPMCRDDAACGVGSLCCSLPGAPAASPYRACADNVTRCP